MGSAADDILGRLEPFTVAYPDPSGNLAAVVDAVMAPVQVVDDVARDSGDSPAWRTLFDPDLTPAVFLRWLAQFNGTFLPPSATVDEQRDRIKHNPGFDDGKDSSMVAEVQRTLTGAKAVRLLKDPSDPWLMSVVTRTAETPDADVTFAAALRQKAAGVKLTHVVSDFALIEDWTLPIDDVTEVIDDLELEDVS